MNTVLLYTQHQFVSIINQCLTYVCMCLLDMFVCGSESLHASMLIKLMRVLIASYVNQQWWKFTQWCIILESLFDCSLCGLKEETVHSKN